MQASAKALWLVAHPDRKQLPDHFDESVYLGFRGIQPGSAVVPIEARVKNPERLRLWEGQDPVSFAARLTYDTFDAARQQRDLPKHFTRRLLADYAKLGQELPDLYGVDAS